MFLVTGTSWQLGVLLLILANLCLGGSLVIYDSLLCRIAEPDDRDRVSSRGWALGYLGGGLLLALNLVAVTLLSEDGNPQRSLDLARWCIVSAGVWWAAFTLVPLAWLREHPGAASTTGHGNVLLDGFRQLGHTIKGIRAYPLTLSFL